MKNLTAIQKQPVLGDGEPSLPKPAGFLKKKKPAAAPKAPSAPANLFQKLTGRGNY